MEKDTEKKCFVCKNAVTRFDSDSGINRERQQGECQRFYSLVCRYLNMNLDGSSGPVLNSSATDPNRTLKRSCENIFYGDEAISCCDICIPLIKSFSDTYNNWKILQLVLNWKLETITKLMLIKSKFEDETDSSNSELFRKRFLALVKDNSRDFPRLLIPKVEDPPATQQININVTTGDPCEPEPTEISDFENDEIEDFNSFNLQDNANQKQKVEPDAKCLSAEEAKVEGNSKSMGMYKCQFCEREFKTKKQRSSHEEIHKGPYKCRICGKPYTDPSGRRRHEKSHKGKLYKCRICGKPFASSSGRRSHEKSHSQKRKSPEPKPYIFHCQFCAKAFKLKHRFIKHERFHCAKLKSTATARSNYKCEVCFQEFKSQNFLTRHQRQIHKDEQPNTCCVCQKTFSSRGTWQRHEKIHKKGQMWYDTRKRDQTNWRFNCAFCPKKFDNEYRKVMHERTHTGQKLYKCRYCVKTYYRFDSRKRHERQSHKPGETRKVNVDQDQSKISTSINQNLEIENERNDDDNKILENDAEDESSINLEHIQVRIIKSEQDAAEPHRDDDNDEAMLLD